jgi:hypothetical protein
MTQSDPRVDRLEGVLERIVAEQSEMRQDMRDFRQDMREIRGEIGNMQTRMLQLWLGTMGTMMAGFIAIFVAILLKG